MADKTDDGVIELDLSIPEDAAKKPPEKKKEDAKALAQQLDMLQQENDALKGHVERLQNDPGAIEHQAREELHYTRPGEVIVTLPPEPTRSPDKK